MIGEDGKVKPGKGVISAAGEAVASKLAMPLPLVPNGTTGMLYSAMHSHNPNDVMDFIIKEAANYPKYKATIWDCEDHAFLAAADIRCRFPGQPIAIAIGTATEPKALIGVSHAVNYLWFERKEGDKSIWDTVKILDTTLPRPGFVGSFNPTLVIPIPVSGTSNHKDLPPFERFAFQPTAAFRLDASYNFTLIESKVIPALEQKPKPDYLRCLKPPQNVYRSDASWDDLRKNSELRTYRDVVFHAFAHIRKEFMGAPVGIAFGTETETNKDSAMLILWSNQNKFDYWDYQEGKYLAETGVKFKPRIAIV